MNTSSTPERQLSERQRLFIVRLLDYGTSYQKACKRGEFMGWMSKRKVVDSFRFRCVGGLVAPDIDIMNTIMQVYQYPHRFYFNERGKVNTYSLNADDTDMSDVRPRPAVRQLSERQLQTVEKLLDYGAYYSRACRRAYREGEEYRVVDSFKGQCSNAFTVPDVRIMNTIMQVYQHPHRFYINARGWVYYHLPAPANQ